MPSVMQQDEIVPIPENRFRYFGGPGRMLLPCPATIAAVIRRIPQSKLITSDLLRKELEEEFDVDGVCPITTKKSLNAVAYSADDSVAYWRVITQDGGLFSTFPGGKDAHAALLMNEGFTIDTHGKTPKVAHYTENLIHFS